MSHPAVSSARHTVESYFALAEKGVLTPDDRVELLEGVIVAMSPHTPRHAWAITQVAEALRRAIDDRAVLRVQLPLVTGPDSAPEPDVFVAPGRREDYRNRHPTSALLVVEVSDSSLQQDRLTKAAIYAAGAVTEYWIVNLKEEHLEIFRNPDPGSSRYRSTSIARRGERVELIPFPGTFVSVAEFLPAE